jgi:AraC family transcriptional regulator of adaptative response/methylated-DNA-[protein]-cysteine methyltransferase
MSDKSFAETFKRAFEPLPGQDEQTKHLVARQFDTPLGATPLGAMIALAGDEGIYLLEFADHRDLEDEILQLRKQLHCSLAPGNHFHLDRLAEELKHYFDGTSLEFTVPLVKLGTPFEVSVWNLLLTIPPGETRSYIQIAQALGQPGATRAVGHANGNNHLAIVIPCHRVIHSDGSMSGYAGGTWRKEWLLDHERKLQSPPGSQLPLFGE